MKPTHVYFNGWAIVRNPVTEEVTVTNMTTGEAITEREREALIVRIDSSIAQTTKREAITAD